MLGLLINILIVAVVGAIVVMIMDKVGLGDWRNIVLAIVGLVIVIMLLQGLLAPGLFKLSLT